MKSPSNSYRPSLHSLQASLKERFLLSLVIGLLILLSTAALLAQFIIPSLIQPGSLTQVVSYPSAQAFEPPPILNPSPITRPLPPPPEHRLTLTPPPMPAAPVLIEEPTIETTLLMAQSEEALFTLEVFEDEKTKRLEEEQAALLAQQQAEEEIKRKRQKASAAQANRIAAPSLARRTPPHYPISARRKGEQGTAQITATITSSGTVDSPRIITSSGHRVLDASALAAVRTWRFNPAKNGLGQSVPFQMTIPVTFRLK